MVSPIICKAVLCDMDGTLVDSTASVEGIWRGWAERHNIDLDHLLSISHGRRTRDTLRQVAPHLDVELEASLLEGQEINWREGIRQVPGAAAFLGCLPDDRWCVVTSASRPLATARLRMAGLPMPAVLVCAEDVSAGKPSPEGYLKAALGLGIDPADCLVLEDTPAGLDAGRSAGAQVLALTTTYPREVLEANSIVDFQELKVTLHDDTIHIHI